jgi:hypothetical protein
MDRDAGSIVFSVQFRATHRTWPWTYSYRHGYSDFESEVRSIGRFRQSYARYLLPREAYERDLLPLRGRSSSSCCRRTFRFPCFDSRTCTCGCHSGSRLCSCTFERPCCFHCRRTSEGPRYPSRIIAQKLKKKIEEIPLSKSIKDLVGGKSTLQNEILGDLNLEFSSAPEKGEELPLDELGSSLSAGYSGALGKHTNGLISRLVGGKMPGGFNLTAIKAYLTKTWGLGPSRSDGVLLLGLTVEPPKRLGSEAEAKTWLDTVVAAYAQQTGVSLSSGAASGGGGGGGGGGAVINSEEFIQFQAEQYEFARRQVELYMRYLDLDPREGARAANNEKANAQVLQDKLDAISREHGDAYINGIQPVFEPLKTRHFDSSWNWVRQDALIMWYDILHGRISTVDRDITARCIAIINRADESLLQYMQYYIDRCDPDRGETYKLGKEFGQQLIDNCREALGQPPLYKDGAYVACLERIDLTLFAVSSHVPHCSSHRGHSFR